MKKYVITGATGKIGKIVATELLAKGQNVTVIGRNPGKLKELADLGAIAMAGDSYDREFLTMAFKGADAVFCLLMPDMFAADILKEQKQIADNYFSAIKAANVPNVVLLSSVGAHLRKGAGIVDGLGYMEELFLGLKDVNVLNLRPTYFMENTLGLIGIIKQMGIAGTAVSADQKFPMVATKDIGAVAAKRLLNLSFEGNTVEYVLGPRDMSYSEVTAIAGQAIGMPELQYMQFPAEEAVKGMVASGFCGEDAARLMVDLAKALNDGSMLNGHQRTEANSTPTTYEEFSQVFAWVFQQS